MFNEVTPVINLISSFVSTHQGKILYSITDLYVDSSAPERPHLPSGNKIMRTFVSVLPTLVYVDFLSKGLSNGKKITAIVVAITPFISRIVEKGLSHFNKAAAEKWGKIHEDYVEAGYDLLKVAVIVSCKASKNNLGDPLTTEIAPFVGIFTATRFADFIRKEVLQ